MIIHLTDYHAVFMVNGIPLVPIQAVIAVFEVRSSVHSASVLIDTYEVLKSVKQLDRSNGGRNYALIDREKVQIEDPATWRRFEFEVFGAVISVESCSDELWLRTTSDWCRDNDRRHWPNFYCGVKDYIGTYHVWRDGLLYANPDHTVGAQALMAFRPPESARMSDSRSPSSCESPSASTTARSGTCRAATQSRSMWTSRASTFLDRMVTLSNGSASAAQQLLERAGLRDQFPALLSVEDASAWKPARAAYEYAARQCGVATDEMVLVAVHPWDLDGASRAGLSTAWIDRDGAAYPSFFAAPT